MQRTDHCVRMAFLSAILIALGVMLQTTAAAQGTSGYLPDPIDTAAISDAAERLGLDADERSDLFDLHEAYLAQFSTLRASSIKAFLDRAPGHATNVIHDPGRVEDVRSWVSTWGQLLARIEQLDQGLFNQIGTLFDDDQVRRERLVVIAAERARERYLQIEVVQMWLAPLYPINLRELIESYPLTDEQREAMLPFVGEMAVRSVPHYRALLAKARNMLVEHAAAMNEQGLFNWPGADGPEGAIEAFRTASLDTWHQVRVDVREAAKKVSEIEMRVLVEACRTLDMETLHDFLLALQRMSATGLTFGSRRGNIDFLFDRALEHEELPENARLEVLVVREAYRTRWNDIFLESLIARVPIFGGRSYMALTEEEIERSNEYMRSNPLIERGRHLDEEIRAALNRAVGPEASARMNAALERHSARRAPTVNPDAILESGRIDPEHLRLIPRQITRADVMRSARVLSLNESQSDLLEVFFDEYLAAMHQIRANEIEAVSANPPSWRLNEEKRRMEPPPSGDLPGALQTRQEAIEAVDRADAAFFRDVESILLDDAQVASMALVRLDRSMTAKAGFIDREGSIYNPFLGHRGNPVAALVAADLPEDEFAVASGVLREMMPMMEARLQSVRASIMEHERAEWAYRAISIELHDAGEPFEAIESHATAQRLEPAARREIAVRRAMIAINRQALEMVGRAIPKESHERIVRAYHRSTYPFLHAEMSEFEQFMEQARANESLTDAGKREIELIRTTLNDECAALAKEMIDVIESSPFQGVRVHGNDEWHQDASERRAEIERLLFNRTEAVARAKERVQIILESSLTQ